MAAYAQKISQSLGNACRFASVLRRTQVFSQHLTESWHATRITPPHCRGLAASPKKKARRQQEKMNGPSNDASRFRRISVALVGRPNVGKSSLYNRLAQQKAAIVHATPGTTRDWKEATGRLGDLEFVVMDTGGLEDHGSVDAIERKMMAHTEVAIRHADVVLFVVDGRQPVTEDDARFARWVKQRRPQGGIHLIANKMEGWGGTALADIRFEEGVQSCYSLGLGDPLPLSAEHGDGLQNLYAVLEPYAVLQPKDEAGSGEYDMVIPVALDPASASDSEIAETVAEVGEEVVEASPASGVRLPLDPRKRKMVLQRLARQAGPVQIAIVGRPNVGKSTVINQLLGEERVLSGPTPGLTRDVTSVDFSVQGRAVRLADTAGMRRYGSWDLSTPLEGEAVGMAKRTLERSNVVILVVDGSGGTPGGLTNDKIRFADRKLLETGSRDAASLGSPSPSDPKCNAIAKVAERVAGSAASRTDRNVTSSQSASRSSRAGMGRPFGLTRQDMSIAEQVLEEGRALVVVLNKLDASPAPEDVARLVRGQLDGMHASQGTEVVPLAALRGRGMEELLPAVLRTYDRWNARVSTARLNTWLMLTLRQHPAPTVQKLVGHKGKGNERKAVTVPLQLRVKYVTQVTTRPPTFSVWCNRPDVPDTYRRFLVNSLREEFGLWGTPVRLHVRAADNPFTAAGRLALGRSKRQASGTQRPSPRRDTDSAPRNGVFDRPQPRAGEKSRPSTLSARMPVRRATEKADGKRRAYGEAASAAAEEGHSRSFGISDISEKVKGASRRPRTLPGRLARLARASAMTGGKVALLPRKQLRKMKAAGKRESRE